MASLSGGDSSRRDELIEDTKKEWFGSSLRFWKVQPLGLHPVLMSLCDVPGLSLSNTISPGSLLENCPIHPSVSTAGTFLY